MNINQRNYVSAKLLATARFEAITDDTESDALWDAYDEAVAKLRAAEGELLAWGELVATSICKPAERQLISEFFKNRKARDKAIELVMKLEG